MSYSPGAEGDLGSPDIFMSNVRCNLDSQFLNARDSIKSENMCVYARVRPMLTHEKAKGFKECLAAIDEQTVRVVVPVTSSKHKSSRQSDEIIEDYTFSSAFGPETGQFVFFQETMLNTMQNFIEGSNSLVFSYGITGSGKTYTLQGNSENPGVIPLSMKLYFGTIEKQLMQEMVVKPHHYCDIVALSEKDRQQEQMIKNQLLSLYDEEYDSAPGSLNSYNSKSFAMSLCEFFYDSYEPEQRLTTLSSEDMAASQAACQLKEISRKCADQQLGVCSVWVSFVEIYNETIFDLLQPFSNKRAKLSLGEDKNGNVYIKGVREICVSNSEEALKILNIGRKQLSIASTKMNYQSSRSHCIYTLRVVRVPDPQNISYGKVNRLSFCDLAGSERASKTQTTGMRLKEAGAINTSLLVLGRCLEQLRMNQMGKEKRMIPFRESKLTRLFSGFFLGQGKAAIIANASPSDYSFDETLHVLKFSALAKKIMVNDTFLSNASSTLQNITNQWHNYKANTSAINESMESVESDSDIIQMKDDLIEKLLELADEQGNELTKEKKEKADLEMKIRQQVCREYSEYSDQIIESHRLNHEAERNSVIEIYKKRIANMERMYEDVIKGYKEQLRDFEADESLNESSVAGNESLNELDSSDRKSLTKTPEFGSLKKDAAALSKTTCSPNSDIETLKLRLSAISNELQNTNALLLKSQNASSNLEIELSISKAEKENLAQKIAEYQNAESKYLSITTEYESQLKDLEKKLSSTRDELSVAKEQVQLKAFNVCELETEIEVCKNEIEILKKVNEQLKSMKTASEADIKNYKQTISDLEQKLLLSERDLEAQKGMIKLPSNEVCALKEAIEICKREIEILKKVNEELKCIKALSEADIKNYKQTISDLEQKLLLGQQDLEAQKGLVKLHSNEVCDLKKAMGIYKKEIQELEKHSKDISNIQLLNRKDMEICKQKLCALEQELQVANKNCDSLEKSNKVKEAVLAQLDKEVDDSKEEYEKLKSFSRETCEKSEKLKLDIEKYKEALCSLQEGNASLKSKIKLLHENEAKLQSMSHLQEEIESYKLEIEKLNKEKVKLENDNVKLKTEIIKYESAVSELELDLSSANNEIGGLKSKITQKTASLAELQNELKSCQKKFAELRKLEGTDSGNSESSCSPETYKSKLKKLENELSSVCQQLEASKIHLELNSLDVSDFEFQIKEGKKKLEALKKEKEKCEFEKNQNLKHKKELEERLSVVIIKTDNEKREFLKKIGELEKDVKTSKASTQKLEDYQETLLAEKLELSTEIHTYETTRKVLEDRLVLKDKELKVAKEEISTHLKEIKNNIEKTKSYEDHIHKLQKDREIFEAEKRELISSILLTHKTEKKDLENKLASTQNDLKVAKQDAEEIQPILSDIENRVEGYEQEIAKLKENQEMSEKEKADLRTIILKNEEKIEDLKKQLSLSDLELKSIKDELLLKDTDVQELKEKMKSIVAEINKLQKSLQEADTEKSKLNTEIASNKDQIKDFAEKLSYAKRELDSTKKEIEEKNLKVQELENEVSQLREELNRKKLELKDALDTLKELEEDFDMNRDQLKELPTLQDEKKALEEKHALLAEKLATLTLEHQSLTEKLSIDEEATVTLKKHIEELEKEMKSLLKSQNQLKDVQTSCDKKLISEKEQHEIEVESVMKLKQLVEEENLHLKKKVSNLKQLEEEKLHLKKEISNLKQLSEEEKLLLKKEISNLKQLSEMNKQPKKEQSKKEISNLKQSSEVNNQPKKEQSKSEKTQPIRQDLKAKPEEQPRVIRKAESTSSIRSATLKQPRDIKRTESTNSDALKSSRALRHKQTDDEVEAPKRVSRKRTSDEDFEKVSSVTRASKKLKTAEDDKIPVTRNLRRKIEPEQNLSPVQKMANCIGQKFKNLSESVSKLSSPRMTRGKRKLYNSETSSSSSTITGKVTRSRKP